MSAPGLAPLFAAGPVVASHAAVALAALALGAVQFALPTGGRRHRTIGWVWIGLMVFVAAGSFGIHRLPGFGAFSPIHALSLFTLVMLVAGVAHARAGRVASHRWTMVGLFFGGLVVTGLFTLWPGRIMHAILFGA